MQLYSALHKATGIRATARVELHETGPPTHSDNDTLKKHGDVLRRSLMKQIHKKEIVMSLAAVDLAVDAKLQEYADEWAPTGMTSQTMNELFPFVDPPITNGLDGKALAADERWMNYGPETKAHALARAQSNADWLRELQATLGNDEIVVCVSHGAIMGMTVRRLLEIDRADMVFGDMPNTAVHVINLPSPVAGPAGPFGPGVPSSLVMEQVINCVGLRARICAGSGVLSTESFCP